MGHDSHSYKFASEVRWMGGGEKGDNEVLDRWGIIARRRRHGALFFRKYDNKLSSAADQSMTKSRKAYQKGIRY